MSLSRKIEPLASDKRRIHYDQMYCLPLVGFFIENVPKEIKPVFVRSEILKYELNQQY